MRIFFKLIDWIATPYSLFLLFRDPAVSWKTKIKAGLILAGVSFYVLNPMDLIPEITPVIGWLDDLLIVPAVMALTGKAIPEINVTDIRRKARSSTQRAMFWAAAFIITVVVLSLSTIGLLIYLAIRG